MPKDLDIKLKGYIREYLEYKMIEARKGAKYSNVSAGIIIRDTVDKIEFEMFLDEMWLFISRKNLQNEHSQS